MRLTQIRLSGFKSFVDPTTINLPGRLVGVVGPNGCGKSNVIDAVRWVLGETRASALRGDSMQDVIFNGSAQRKPTARASVELMFDNSLGRVGGQWAGYGEISVRRVLQRDGESSYYLNGSHVRRRDVTDIFLGTGLGPRAYAIIEQGMISRVIEARPEDLRIFLEEAAGVSRYRERRRETESRLADATENLQRVNDIRGELATQLEKLESQAEVARRYRELQEQAMSRQHMLWYLRMRDAAGEAEKLRATISAAGIDLERLAAEQRGTEAKLESARADHFAAADALNALQAELYAVNTEVARAESELRHAEEMRQRLEELHAERVTQLKGWREQRSQLTQALHLWLGRETGYGRLVVAAREQAVSAGAGVTAAEAGFRQALEAVNELRAAVQAADAEAQIAQSALDQLRAKLDSLGGREQRLEQALSALPAPAALQAELARDRDALAEAQRLLDAGVLVLEAGRAEVERVGPLRQAAAGQAEQRQRELAVLHARRTALSEIQDRADADASEAAWLVETGIDPGPRLWRHLRIESGWELAVEAVLREQVHAVCLNAPAVLERLNRNPAATRSSLALTGEPRHGVEADAAAPLLRSKIVVEGTALGGALADFLAGVFASEDSPPARDLLESLPPGARMVDRKGHLYTALTTTFHAADRDTGLLQRKAEIEGIDGRLPELERRSREAQAEVAALEAAASAAQARVESCQSEQAALALKIRETELQLQRTQQTIDDAQARRSAIADERMRVLAEIGSDETARSQAAARLAQAQAARELGEVELRDARTDREARELALLDARQALQRAEREAQTREFEHREATAKIAEIGRAIELIDAQLAQAEAEIERVGSELAVNPVPGFRSTLDAAIEARIIRERAVGEGRDRVEAAAATLREVEEARIRLEAALAPLRERLGELRLKEQAARLGEEQFRQQLSEAGAELASLQAGSADAARPAGLQAEIGRLTQELSSLGAVNLAALEELAAERERKAYLDAQSVDLEEAVATLKEAIGRIDRETRELLRDTYASVNRHFGMLFPVLFGGGEARLHLTGEEILDSGVQVIAQPPGKRTSSIHLLSGGEKALTAIALVFSLFQLNPAPFCLLDEVDAPLDDSNTARFCELVRRMSAQTQFLFISHNKITMELAEQLVGVTMPESGVSRVVAVDIAQALELREAEAA